ncbi:DoxX family protein [uncultured Shewanella sp.]|uniref:HvfX family Cu-binding RiPP maturation protein n=1 Tax=uncultured Shewanella sp. TaxID=173975 RepID=UPI002631C755|nr:DoxX family protein [uncultured Shewanella sp.]
MSIKQIYQGFLKGIGHGEGLAPLALRLYLAPVLIQAGYNKWLHFDDTVAWFGNSDWGLGLPFPMLLAAAAVLSELVGGLLLVIGLATRLIAIPLMVTMLVAAFSVHWENGWLAIADHTSWLANEEVFNAAEKLSRAKAILQEHGNYEWLTSSGNIVIINNGIEFAITYFCMLLVLFFMGGGRYTSLDYIIAKRSGLA